MITPVVILLPGPDVRMLGMSLRVRNERVATRAGATVVSADKLPQYRDRATVVVAPDRLIDLGDNPLTSPAALVERRPDGAPRGTSCVGPVRQPTAGSRSTRTGRSAGP